LLQFETEMTVCHFRIEATVRRSKLKDIPVRYFGKAYGVLKNKVEESHKH